MDEMTASEALFGFMAWLTTREAVETFSAKHNVAPAADLMETFCKTNNLVAPREDWTDRLTHPSS